MPQTAFSHYGAGVKPSILFLRKFSEREYIFYQASITQIKEKNEAVYTPRVKELDNERKSVIARGCPAQIEVTNLYRLRFQGILANIDILEQRLGKTPTKRVKSLRGRFIRDQDPQIIPQLAHHSSKALRAQLKVYITDLNTLDKEYREAFDAEGDSEWESEVKAEYREKINGVKEELSDKNSEDFRQWIQNNANYPIFMASAERIGYDATGRKDPINDLDMICEEFQRFMKNPDFFG